MVKGWKANYVDKIPNYLGQLGIESFQYITRLRTNGKHLEAVGWRALINEEYYGDWVTLPTNEKITEAGALKSKLVDEIKELLLNQCIARAKTINEQREPEQPDRSGAEAKGQSTRKKTGGKTRKAKG